MELKYYKSERNFLLNIFHKIYEVFYRLWLVFNHSRWQLKKHFRNNLIQHTRISSSLKINTFNGRCIKDLWWQECSKFQNQAKLIYLHQTFSKVKKSKIICLIDMVRIIKWEASSRWSLSPYSESITLPCEIRTKWLPGRRTRL